MTRKLVVFDVDGTLVDSQADIIHAMTAAFAAIGAPAPSRGQVLSIVGLSLPQAIARLSPGQSEAVLAQMVDAYKEAYFDRMEGGAPEPLFDGAREVLTLLNSREDFVLGVATGKSRRGLDRLIEAHGLVDMFVTLQTGDVHASKPHPEMLQAALAEADVEPDAAVMIGDTSYDMGMARAAGVAAFGVTWGYHRAEELGEATRLVSHFHEVPPALAQLWRYPV
ncbi:HAD-IA family hydrolase [Poseidonocella sedimentorum]|uniref:Phosphoglycolate phosphatase n=1 Tax=Poseidonocella sedimentorum TaxID=871652 RepID=A0A1I6DMQ2_9RHOB|nr:HAD-IA family hydrolase [Poseidonocella sedimentorum]SFR06704.1 phosphoglycolate phosphatase [Poseidonocella sedimentorum]